MVRSKKGYSIKDESSATTCRAKATNMKVRFKNTMATAKAVRGKTLAKAELYLKDVIQHKQCVPFTRHNGGVGRCAQAKAFRTTQGRWPEKSAKFLLDLLRNAASNASYEGLDYGRLYIKYIQVNPSPSNHRRTFRAHGRITPYKGYHCHFAIVLSEMESSENAKLKKKM